jgi:hypothetical protein
MILKGTLLVLLFFGWNILAIFKHSQASWTSCFLFPPQGYRNFNICLVILFLSKKFFPWLLIFPSFPHQLCRPLVLPSSAVSSPFFGRQFSLLRPSVLPSSAVSSPFLGHQFSLPRPSVLPSFATSSLFLGHQFSLPRPSVLPSFLGHQFYLHRLSVLPFRSRQFSLPRPSVLPSSAISSPFLGHQFSLPSLAINSPFLSRQFFLPRPSVLPSFLGHQFSLPSLAISSPFLGHQFSLPWSLMFRFKERHFFWPVVLVFHNHKFLWPYFSTIVSLLHGHLFLRPLCLSFLATVSPVGSTLPLLLPYKSHQFYRSFLAIISPFWPLILFCSYHFCSDPSWSLFLGHYLTLPWLLAFLS